MSSEVPSSGSGSHEPAAQSTPTYGPPVYPPPPPGYVPPGYVPVAYAPVKGGTNGFAIASMVLGIIWIYWIGSVLALVFGYIARSQIEKSQPRQSGNGMAVAGIVLGWIGLGILGLIIVVSIASTASARR